MASQFNRFKDTLSELFMLDQAELDFGIYRIMNQKRTEINRYLEVDLVNQVKEVLAANAGGKRELLQKEIAEATKSAEALGVDANTLPKIQSLKAELAELGGAEDLENEVYDHLATFFKRYYDGGDFISLRRYKKDVYAIPYEGEEVKLHWANADQYYIKTSEYFRNYSFKLTDDKRVSFVLIEASTEQNNNKSQGDKERRFALYTEQPVVIEGNELHINFTYDPTDKKVKQKDLITVAYDTVKPLIPLEFAELFAIRATDKNKNRTLLEKHFTDYVAKNTFDYFIHKDLRGFLTRELDFYIKNEVLFIDDINTKQESEFLKHLSAIKAVKAVGAKIIEFLSSLEDFQKKLWLKKKFVTECNYCITLDRVPEVLYAEVVTNDAQREEWVRLFAINEIKGSEGSGGLFNEGVTAGYTVPLTIDFLKSNSYLVLDTAFFENNFRQRLVSSIDNFEEQLDGTLINSENFQALNLLQEKYQEQVKSIYIDPPYNTGEDGFPYKDTFKGSSWLSMFSDRLNLSYSMMNEEGFFMCHMDEHEHFSLEWLVKKAFGSDGDMGKLIWDKRNPKGDAKGLAVQHEYVHFATNNPLALKNNTFIRKKENAEAILAKAVQLINKAKGVTDNVRVEFKAWIKKQDFTGGEKAYEFIDDNGNVYQSVSMAWPNKKKAPDDYFIPLIHPITKKPCPVPFRGWRNPPSTMAELLENNFILFGDNESTQPRRKYLLKDNLTENVSSLYYMGGSDDAMFENMGFMFENPKPIKAAQYFINTNAYEGSPLILDYFAGSGTTGHAVINLNREDQGKRKYILVEMGTYFDKVTKPRIQKVIYSKDWREGKPVSREGSSHCFKYLRLEQYEDTLNNLVVKQKAEQKDAFNNSDTFRESFLLGYMLDTETKESLLNTDWFVNPFAVSLHVTRQNEMQQRTIDLVETFNYLIGLNIEAIGYPKEGICTVTGTTRRGERSLVIWRDCTKIDNAALNTFFKKSAYSTRDNEFDRIYINGDNNLENLRTDQEHWKVVLTEEEFAKRMFEK
ncbi:MAG: site-specific DNA-methyltransferase [Phocaeicola sp.]